MIDFLSFIYNCLMKTLGNRVNRVTKVLRNYFGSSTRITTSKLYLVITDTSQNTYN